MMCAVEGQDFGFGLASLQLILGSMDLNQLCIERETRVIRVEN